MAERVVAGEEKQKNAREKSRPAQDQPSQSVPPVRQTHHQWVKKRRL